MKSTRTLKQDDWASIDELLEIAAKQSAKNPELQTYYTELRHALNSQGHVRRVA